VRSVHAAFLDDVGKSRQGRGEDRRGFQAHSALQPLEHRGAPRVVH